MIFAAGENPHYFFTFHSYFFTKKTPFWGVFYSSISAVSLPTSRTRAVISDGVISVFTV